MKGFWSKTQYFVIVIVLSFVVSPFSLVQAQTGEGPKPPQDMQQVLEMLKKSGMDPKQLQQMEDMFKGMEGKGKGKKSQRSSGKLKKAQQKFEAETAGHGIAKVEVDGKQYKLKMTQCKITDRNSGHFSMGASQAPGNENAKLLVSGGGGHSGNVMQFTGKKIFYEAAGYPIFQFNG